LSNALPAERAEIARKASATSSGRAGCPSGVLRHLVTRTHVRDASERKRLAGRHYPIHRRRRDTLQHRQFHTGSVGVRGSNPLSSTVKPQFSALKCIRMARGRDSFDDSSPSGGAPHSRREAVGADCIRDTSPLDTDGYSYCEKQRADGSRTITSVLLGALREDPRSRHLDHRRYGRGAVGGAVEKTKADRLQYNRFHTTALRSPTPPVLLTVVARMRRGAPTSRLVVSGRRGWFHPVRQGQLGQVRGSGRFPVLLRRR
jgi:hypothetical protein